MKIIRHGDVALYAINKIKGREIKNNGSFVLAEGETTGHKHLLTCERMIVKKAKDGRYYLSLEEEGSLTHQEHKTLTIPAGDYVVYQEREKDHFSLVVRKVID